MAVSGTLAAGKHNGHRDLKSIGESLTETYCLYPKMFVLLDAYRL